MVGGIVVLSDPSVLGAYSGLTSGADFGRGVPLTGRQALAFIAMSAVLPFIIALAVSLRRRAWDEQQLRPLLVVFWVATVALVVETGFLTTAFAAGRLEHPALRRVHACRSSTSSSSPGSGEDSSRPG